MSYRRSLTESGANFKFEEDEGLEEEEDDDGLDGVDEMGVKRPREGYGCEERTWTCNARHHEGQGGRECRLPPILRMKLLHSTSTTSPRRTSQTSQTSTSRMTPPMLLSSRRIQICPCPSPHLPNRLRTARA